MGGDWFDLGGLMNSLTPQSFNKGNLIGIHTLKINLKRGSTLKQFEDYFLNNLIPNYRNLDIKVYRLDCLLNFKNPSQVEGFSFTPMPQSKSLLIH
jgi:hypothetical protein